MKMTKFLANLTDEAIMLLWDDTSITDVKNKGEGFYSFKSRMVSHGELICNLVTIEVIMTNDLDLCCYVDTVKELHRTAA